MKASPLTLNSCHHSILALCLLKDNNIVMLLYHNKTTNMLIISLTQSSQHSMTLYTDNEASIASVIDSHSAPEEDIALYLILYSC